MPQKKFTQTSFDPQLLAKQTAAEIMETIKKERGEQDMLTSLQLYSETLRKSQEMYSDYMAELSQKIKQTKLQNADSISNLKKEVLRHILDIEKDKQRT